MIRALFRPWRVSSTWWALTHVLLDLPVGIVTFVIVFPLLVLTGSLLIVLPGAIVTGWFLFVGSRVLGTIERTRFSALLGVELVDPVPPLAASSTWGRFVERLRCWPRWREIGYLVLLLPLGTVTFVGAFVAWCGSLGLILLPAYVAHLPGATAKFWLFTVEQGPQTGALCLLGVVGFALLAPWTTVALARLDVVAARHLLARPPDEVAAARVAAIESSRMAAVDSAEAERRRIERDLHDGTQARLVALAMDLGTARERLEHDPEAGRELVAEAHEEVKATLKELRDLVRGIHPAILEDRGLDAALSAVVARCPIPVHLEVDVGRRPSPATESTAYFVISESLTNVARHAEATRASVSVARRGDRLVIEVSDDGIGGVDPSRGTGLRGLEDRVSSLGGWLQVVSPPGGPTTLFVEVPCGS